MERLFGSLGRALDERLASRTLSLALSGGVPAAFASSVVSTTSQEHPRLAFDFAIEREKAMLELVEPSSRWAFIPALAETSFDPALAAKVRDYAERSLPSDARQEAERVIADITYRAEIKAHQLPTLEAWLGKAAARASPRRSAGAHE
jgi:aminopeptidase N